MKTTYEHCVIHCVSSVENHIWCAKDFFFFFLGERGLMTGWGKICPVQIEVCYARFICQLIIDHYLCEIPGCGNSIIATLTQGHADLISLAVWRPLPRRPCTSFLLKCKGKNRGECLVAHSCVYLVCVPVGLFILRGRAKVG